MKRFVFSADGHIKEPADLFLSNIPPSMHKLTLRSEKSGEYMLVLAGEKILFRNRLKPLTAEIANFGRPNQKGAVDLDARLEDMRSEGIDAEILFPTSGMMTFLLENTEAELAATQAYNDFINKFVDHRRNIFVRCAVLPLRNKFQYTIQEMKRVAALGITCVMIPAKMPAGVPHYNDSSWDPIFEAAQNLNLVFVIHTATGREDVRMERGPGGALINYTHQMIDSLECTMYLVGGGILDRFPKVHVAFVECGAGWLAAVGERLDEVYHGHQFFVSPKLSAPPTEIIKRQLHASFQHDRSCILTRSVTGHRALMWGADYPHHEGTFPNSREIVDHMFDGIDITEEEKADILGGNAAHLFRLERTEVPKAA
jgi:predicted TIM-barrel fold metal-dependent hydrolase